MNTHDDELLSSYLDSELAAAEARELERRLAKDRTLQARLEALRGADAATRKLYAAVDAAPMPASVSRLLAAAEPAAKPVAKSKRSNVLAFPARGLRQFWQMPVAIAASVALVVGFMVSKMAEQVPDAASSTATLTARTITPDSDLFGLLEGQASGQAASLGGGISGQALLSFTDHSGRYCRQLRLDGAAASTHAVACREASGWTLEALAYGDAMTDGQYQQASSATPVSIGSAIDGLIGARDPLDPEEENIAISKGWEKSQ
jgi:negative regulator of sigma E activity